jgi:hypothetical protein
MSYASMTLSIIFIINLGLFLWSFNGESGCSVCSPMFNITASMLDNKNAVSWTSGYLFAEGGKIILTALSLSGIIWLVQVRLSGASGGLTGATSQVNPLLIIALSFFVVFAALPNFSGLGLPNVLDIAIRSIFGFMVMLSVFGILRGE